jgi:hypothetical protein
METGFEMETNGMLRRLKRDGYTEVLDSGVSQILIISLEYHITGDMEIYNENERFGPGRVVVGLPRCLQCCRRAASSSLRNGR